MKIKFLIKFLVIMILIISIQFIIITQISNAAIEVKPGATRQVSVTVNDAYNYCYGMRNPTSSLGNNGLDSHMAKATDWGITAYLSLSSYGGVTSATGSNVTINSTNYTTTTGNKTGVMDFGKTLTMTSSYLDGSSSSANRSTLYDAANSKYVDVIGAENTVEYTRGMAITETSGWYSNAKASFYDSARPIGVRGGVYGYYAGGGGNNYSRQGDGEKHNDVTYRPVIWN